MPAEIIVRLESRAEDTIVIISELLVVDLSNDAAYWRHRQEKYMREE